MKLYVKTFTQEYAHLSGSINITKEEIDEFLTGKELRINIACDNINEERY